MDEQPTRPPSQPPTPPPPTPPTAPPVEPLPFEDPARPFFQGLLETVRQMIFEPALAFGRMSLDVDLTRPLLYAILVAWAGSIVSYLWGFLVQGSILSMLPGRFGKELFFPFAMSGAAGFAMLILLPVFIIIGLFIWTAILHLFLMLVGGANKGFAATLRVACYSNTAQLANVVPLVGGLVVFVWSIVLLTIGLSSAHRTTQGRALAAVLLPYVLCCVCIGILGAMGLLAGAAAMMGSGN